MDYRDLLKRYMRRVIDSEGDAFLPYGATDDRTPGGAPTATFTEAEAEVLRQIEAEALEDDLPKVG